MYIALPYPLTEELFAAEFGEDAYRFYAHRIRERINNGHIYFHPLKTMYIWAAQDRAAAQGYYKPALRVRRCAKNKNHGRS